MHRFAQAASRAMGASLLLDDGGGRSRRRRRKHRTQLLLAGLALSLAGCGGGGGGIASTPAPPASALPTPAPTPSPTPTPTPTPAPTPTPTPTPAPPPFQPTAATLFAEPLYNPLLAVAGKGWQYDYVPNQGGAGNLRSADNFSISYDPGSKTYQVSVPVAGSGTIMRTEDYTSYPYSYSSGLPGFHADPSNKSPTSYCCNSLSLSAADRPQSRYRYVSFADFYAPAPAGPNRDTIAYGTFAVGQPTKAGEVPVTGTARYTGHAFGHFAGDSAATWIEGVSRFDFDFARAALSGEIIFSMRCMMGCLYPETTYTLTNTRFEQGATTFSGSLTTQGATSTGSFSGLFAGPGAAEMMAQFEIPYFNPEYQKWMPAGGAIAGKRD